MNCLKNVSIRVFDFSDQVKLIRKGLAKGIDKDQVLDRLYNRAVTLGKKHAEKKKEIIIILVS